MTVEQFLEKTDGIAYQNRGIFPSELYLFVDACERFHIERIVESGVCAGYSTRMLHACYPGRVVSIEADATRLPKAFPLPVVIGNGVRLVPDFISDYRNQSTAVLLDGPKSVRARRLRDECLESPWVHVVALHDVPRGHGEQAHSLDPDFRKTTGEGIDTLRVPPQHRAKFPAGAAGLGVWWQ